MSIQTAKGVLSAVAILALTASLAGAQIISGGGGGSVTGLANPLNANVNGAGFNITGIGALAATNVVVQPNHLGTITSTQTLTAGAYDGTLGANAVPINLNNPVDHATITLDLAQPASGGPFTSPVLAASTGSISWAPAASRS